MVLMRKTQANETHPALLLNNFSRHIHSKGSSIIQMELTFIVIPILTMSLKSAIVHIINDEGIAIGL